MQTFLPYKSIQKSMKCLDYKRLGKQRVEAMQILKALNDVNYGWRNHPCVKMWSGYEDALKAYMNASIVEWIDRGYNNTMLIVDHKEDYKNPSWLGDSRVHDSHKSNLLRKEPQFYKKYNWKVPDTIEYYWAGHGKNEKEIR